MGFYPRELHELLASARAEQQTPAWKSRYAMRAGVESTINEFVHGHGMRRCRYRSRDRAHAQHVLTAIAINVERISAQAPGSPGHHPRQPTAFQNYLDHRGLPRPRKWRATGLTRTPRFPTDSASDRAR
ncbi:transposase [Streptomyces sp. NPDC052496]|uniref:transposase n=1 Tax=Streptomyces sp. NPDC052496 TaxID=3154951 RepID=UPI003435B53B